MKRDSNQFSECHKKVIKLPYDISQANADADGGGDGDDANNDEYFHNTCSRWYR